MRILIELLALLLLLVCLVVTATLALVFLVYLNCISDGYFLPIAFVALGGCTVVFALTFFFTERKSDDRNL